MYPLVLVMLGAMLFSWHFALTQPKEIAFQQSVASDVLAANFWSYRQSVVTYKFANPGATGVIADASLTFEPGHIRNSAWRNVVQSGTLYTYSSGSLPPYTVEAIARRGGRSLMIGVAQSGGTMTSLTGGASNFILPMSIPTGAVVVIGS